ncbi:MAG: tetratricopeptide repeat protein [Pirellulales bacterium]
MRRLNIKFLGILLVSTLVVVVGVHLLHGYNVDKTTRLLLVSAEDAVKEGKTQRAIQLYMTYDKQSGEGDTAGIRNAAQLALEQAKTPSATTRELVQAYHFMEEALRKEPENNELRREFVELLMSDARFGKDRMGTALVELQKLRDDGGDDPDLLFMLARANESLGHEPEAVEALSRLTGFDEPAGKFGGVAPLAADNLEAYVLLAQIMHQRRAKPLLADMIVDRMVSTNNNNGMAYVLRGRYKRAFNERGGRAEREQRLEDANADIKMAYQKSPAEAEVILEAAQLALREQDNDRAVEMLQGGMTIHPDDPRFIQQLALATRMAGRGDEAIAFAQQGLEEQPENQSLLILLYELQLDLQKLAGAQQSVDKMKELEFPNEIVAVNQARLDLRTGKTRQAAQALERGRSQVDRNPFYRRAIDQDLGLAYRQLGQPDMQLEAFSRWLQYEPSSQPALRGRAEALQRLGQVDEAMAAIQTLGREMGSEAFTADQQLTAAMLRLAKIKQAREPNDKRWERMVETLSGAVRKSVEGDAQRSQLAQIGELLAAGKVDEAIEKLEQLIAANPENLALRLNLIRLHGARDGAAAGLQTLRAAKTELGDSPQIRLLEVLLLMESNDPDADAQVEQLAQDLDGFSPAERRQLLSQLGLIFWTKKNAPQRAREFWEAAKQLEPDDPRMYQSLFTLARRTQDNEAARAAVAEMKERFGEESSVYLAAQAQLLIDGVEQNADSAGDLEQARRLAAEARKQRPNWHEPLQLLGHVERLSGNPTAAVTHYLEALDSGPADAETIRRTSILLMQLNRFQESREVLNRLGSDDNEQTQRLKLYSDVQTGNTQEALAMLAKVAPEDSTDANDWLWRGQILKQLQKNEEAEQAFRRAVELSPEAPANWNALVEHLVATDQREEAEQLTREAELRLPEDASTRLLASCYAMLGNNEQAEHYLQKALDQEPEDLALRRSFATFLLQTNQAAKARDALADLASREQVERVNQPHVHWARRALANLTSLGGDYGQFRQAVRMIENNATDGKLADDDLRVLAAMHGRRTEPASTRQALALLGRVEANQELAPEEQLLKARMLDRTGQWFEAREIMTKLVSTKPSPQALLVFSRMLIDHESPRQAATWVNRLAQQNPEALEVVQMKAEIYIKMNRVEKAVEELDNWITAGANKEQQAARARVAASLLEQHDEHLQARKMFERLVALQPAAELELLAFAARTGNIAAAFDKLDSRLDAQTAIPLCRLGVTVLRERPGDIQPAERERIADWFERSRQLLPGSLALEFEWASYNDVIHDHDETIATYRRLLESDLGDVQRGMVANNLAFKLALQGKALAEALQLVNKAIDTLGPSTALLDTRGMVYLQMHRDDDALRDFQDATSTSPISGDLLFHLALAQQAKADPAAAYEAMEKARMNGFDPLKLDPLSRPMHDRLMDWLRR